jgi:hypothetical protein
MVRLILISLFLSGCATTGSKLDESSKAISSKLVAIMANDAASRIKNSYNTKKVWKLDTSNKYGLALSVDLRKQGFGVDESSKSGDEIIFFVDRLNTVAYRSSLSIGKTILSRAYMDGTLPVPISDWTVGVYHE